MNPRVPMFASAILLAALNPCLAQFPTVTAGQQPVETERISAQSLVRRVLAEVDAQAALAAKVRFKIELLDQTHFGAGSYQQQGRGVGRRLRFDLQVDAPAGTHRRSQICDGSQLWIVDQVGATNSVARVDLARVRTATPKSNLGAGNFWLGLGGLPKLLASLDREYSFQMVQSARLGELEVYVAEGVRASTGDLPPNVPDRIAVHIGRDDFLPYRFEYRRVVKDSNGREQEKQLCVMELYEMEVGAQIDPGRFAFDPGQQLVADATPGFLESMGLEEVVPAPARRPTPPVR